ncbi:MAG: T9SS type A sorting domain-containing protein [Bacteroidales bacterium]|nr:T9SS type A sorting domain-containing protein [Bacteroidales bacterium]
MKKIKLIIVFSFIWTTSFSQIVFNRIIEDTAANITSSVIDVDTGYVYVTGTNNPELQRCFALFYVDNEGIRQWKKIFSENNFEFWEGWANNFKEQSGDCFLTGSALNSVEVKRGIHFTEFDDQFNLLSQHISFYDTIYKKAYYSIKDLDKNYYSTGQIYDYENEKFRLLLFKADSLGNYLWHKILGNYVYEYGSYLLKTSAGTILTGGETWLTDISRAKWYLVNTDTAGNIIWEKYFGRDNYNNGYIKTLMETSDSNILACGVYPAAKYGSGSDQYLFDGCLRKIDFEGNLLWEKHYRSYLLSHTGDIYFQNNIYSVCEKSGYLYALGWNYGYVSWKDRAYLTKMDKEGNILWKREYYAIDTNSYSQWLVSFKTTNDNGFILAGYGNEYNTHGYDPPQQAWLVKTDSLGMDGLCNTEPDELNVDIDLPEIPQNICMNDTINVYVHIAGKSAPYTIEFSTGQVIDSIYYPPTFVPVEIGLTYINLTWGGSTFFEETITEATLTNHEWGQCIAKPVEFYTPHTPGLQQITITVTDAYGESKTISKSIVVNDCGVGMENFDNEAIKIYPNPANKSLTICLPGNTNQATAVITDVLGRVYGRYDLQGKESEIDISHLQPGNYFLQITFNGKTKNLRFVKE